MTTSITYQIYDPLTGGPCWRVRCTTCGGTAPARYPTKTAAEAARLEHIKTHHHGEPCECGHSEADHIILAGHRAQCRIPDYRARAVCYCTRYKPGTSIPKEPDDVTPEEQQQYREAVVAAADRLSRWLQEKPLHQRDYWRGALEALDFVGAPDADLEDLDQVEHARGKVGGLEAVVPVELVPLVVMVTGYLKQLAK